MNHTMWAGTNTGLYVSDDGGSNWTKVRTPTSGPRCGIVVSPQFPTDHTLFVLGDRVVRSVDAGQTWHQISLDVTASALAASPDGRTLVAVSDSGEVERSTDDGNSWTQVGSWQAGLPGGGFVVYDTRFINPATVLITTGDGIYRSTDAGLTWTWANDGLPSVADFDVAGGSPFRRIPRVVGVAETATGALFAALLMGSRGRLYRSSDDGATWQLVGQLPGRPSVATVDPAGRTLYLGTRDAGLFESNNAGDSWNPVGTDLADEDIAAVAFAPSSADATVPVVGTSYDGVFRLENSRWINSFAGFPQTDPVLALLVRHHGETIYAGTLSGVYRSTDAGGSWFPDDSGLPGERSTSALAPLPDGDVLAGTSNGLFRRHRDRWHAFGPRLTSGLSVWSVASAGGSRIAAGTENGFFATADDGRSWRMAVVGAMDVSEIELDRYGMSYLNAGELDRIAPGRQTTVVETVGGESVAAFLRLGTGFVVATAGGVYRRSSHHWRRTLSASLGDSPVLTRIGSRQILVAGDTGLFQSNNSGRNWQRVPVPGRKLVTAIAGHAGHVVVALDGSGMWRYAG